MMKFGRKATEFFKVNLQKKYKIYDKPAPFGKDCNDYLCFVLRHRNFNKSTKEMVRKREKVR